MGNELISKDLSEFLKFVRQVQSDYNIACDNMNLCDKATQDYLHDMEFGDYESQRKVGPKLAKVRQARRIYKDASEVLEPLATFLKDQNTKAVFNKLSDILGKTRQLEKRQEGRVYYARVIKELGFLKSYKEVEDKWVWSTLILSN